MALAAIVDLDSRSQAAEALAAHRQERLRIGAERLALAAHWCDLHPVDDDGEPVPLLPGRRRGRPAGADGTPEVDEFAACELGVLLGVHPHAATALMADAVNLRHRHPRLWERVMAGEVEDWVACKTARAVAAAGLDVNAARWVDAATHVAAGALPPARYLTLVDARIVEADLEAAEARRRELEASRFVRVGQSTELGIKTVVARASAGDVIFLDAMVARIAEILAAQGDLDPLDVRRSKALGILATPERALQLLTGEPVAGTKPQAVLHVHVTRESLTDGAGVARVEQLGPVTAEQAREWLGHCDVSVRPVVDLDDQNATDAYEVPTRLGEAARLRFVHEAFPWATRRSRGADLDHTVPYRLPDEGGPPQTRVGNLAPLHRRHHRLKTHAPGWRVRQPRPGVLVWETPTGTRVRVDHTGSCFLDDSPGERALSDLVRERAG